MIYTDLTKKAMRIAYDAHKEQTDKNGLPYIYHPIHLAEQMTDELSICASLLHDVVEDSPLTFVDLERLGIPKTVIAVLRLLTHDDDTPYMEYVQRIKTSGNQAAIAIKLADLRHNADVTRLDAVKEKDAARIEKYRAATELLLRS